MRLLSCQTCRFVQPTYWMYVHVECKVCMMTSVDQLSCLSHTEIVHRPDHSEASPSLVEDSARLQSHLWTHTIVLENIDRQAFSQEHKINVQSCLGSARLRLLRTNLWRLNNEQHPTTNMIMMSYIGYKLWWQCNMNTVITSLGIHSPTLEALIWRQWSSYDVILSFSVSLYCLMYP